MELQAKHFQLLLTLTDEAAPLWQTIGVELGFTSSELSVIASGKPLLIPEGALAMGYYREMIAQWLQWATPNHPLPTVEALTSALRKAGREQLALDFEKIKSEKGCGIFAVTYSFKSSYINFINLVPSRPNFFLLRPCKIIQSV